MFQQPQTNQLLRCCFSVSLPVLEETLFFQPQGAHRPLTIWPPLIDGALSPEIFCTADPQFDFCSFQSN